MTVTVDEKYDADTGPDDFLQADEPPEPEAPGDVSAGDDGAEGEAPYGWTRDRESGQLRPKRRPGRPKTPPGADEVTAGPPVSRAADRAPDASKRARFTWNTAKGSTVTAEDVAMPKGGVIAAGVNKIYRRIGKAARAFDYEVGEAIIACTRREEGDEADELTVGEAWENLCRTNPRIRRAVMKAIAGGAAGDLFMAHAPIGLALLMKPWVRKLIPLDRLVGSMAEPDEDTPEGEGGLPGGMTEGDFESMRAMAEEQAAKMAARMGMTVTPEQMAEASAQAAAQMPPAFRRTQPAGGRSRAKRRAGAR